MIIFIVSNLSSQPPQLQDQMQNQPSKQQEAQVLDLQNQEDQHHQEDQHKKEDQYHQKDQHHHEDQHHQEDQRHQED